MFACICFYSCMCVCIYTCTYKGYQIQMRIHVCGRHTHIHTQTRTHHFSRFVVVLVTDSTLAQLPALYSSQLQKSSLVLFDEFVTDAGPAQAATAVAAVISSLAHLSAGPLHVEDAVSGHLASPTFTHLPMHLGLSLVQRHCGWVLSEQSQSVPGSAGRILSSLSRSPSHIQAFWPFSVHPQSVFITLHSPGSSPF